MKLPDVLIYNPQGTNLYRMISTKEKKLVGQMIAHPNINHQIEIAELYVFRRRQGFGKKFLDFARNLSRKHGYEGHMILNASRTPYDPHNPPHIFYRKYGFTSDNKKMIKKIDNYIKKKKQLNAYQTPSLIMYYPDDKPKKQSFFDRIKKLFR